MKCLKSSMAGPSAALMRAMGLSGVNPAFYEGIHGSCSDLDPFGERVFAGMQQLLPRYHHDYKFREPLLNCWVFYQSDVPYSKAQMAVELGKHSKDSNIGRWYPAIGCISGEHVICACLGKLWLDMPPWWVHRSRIASAAPPPEPEEPPPPPPTPPSTPPPPPPPPPSDCTDLDAMD